MLKEHNFKSQVFHKTFIILFQVNKRIFVITLITGILQATFYPILLLIIWSLFAFLSQKEYQTNGFVMEIFLITGTILVLLIIQNILNIINDTYKGILQTKSSQYIQTCIIEKMTKIPYSLFEDNRFQADYSLVIGQASYRPSQLVDALLNSITNIISFISIVSALFIISRLLVVLLISVCLLIAVEVRFRNRTVEFQTSASPDLFRMQYLSQKSIDSTWQRDLRIYSSSILKDEYQIISQRYISNLQKLLIRFLILRSGTGVLIAIFITLAVAGILWLVHIGTLTLAQAGILFPALYFSLLGASALATSLGSLTECIAYIEQVFTFLERPFEQTEQLSRVTSVSSEIGISVDTPMEEVGISLENVTFRYPHTSRDALHLVSYNFRTGITAIVGPNGSGKSTLVKLLTNLISPTSGIISLNKIERASGTGKKPNITALFQEPSHLYLTVRQNITLSTTSDPAEDESLYKVLEVVGLRTVVQNLPEGLDTLVGAGFGGQVDLSGGQWQRLALARLIYHDSPIIILDEPVASLDPEGERSIFEIFTQQASSKIIIFTTHRYDSIPEGANILVLVDGTVRESGTHQELIMKRQDYWLLYNKYPYKM